MGKKIELDLDKGIFDIDSLPEDFIFKFRQDSAVVARTVSELKALLSSPPSKHAPAKKKSSSAKRSGMILRHLQYNLDELKDPENLKSAASKRKLENKIIERAQELRDTMGWKWLADRQHGSADKQRIDAENIKYLKELIGE